MILDCFAMRAVLGRTVLALPLEDVGRKKSVFIFEFVVQSSFLESRQKKEVTGQFHEPRVPNRHFELESEECGDFFPHVGPPQLRSSTYPRASRWRHCPHVSLVCGHEIDFVIGSRSYCIGSKPVPQQSWQPVLFRTGFMHDIQSEFDEPPNVGFTFDQKRGVTTWYALDPLTVRKENDRQPARMGYFCSESCASRLVGLAPFQILRQSPIHDLPDQLLKCDFGFTVELKLRLKYTFVIAEMTNSSCAPTAYPSVNWVLLE
jgi:hypothetical protein